MSMESRPYLLHALSPLHVGTGQSVGLIDLPIARLRATNIPFVPGSSLKGVLREARRSLPFPEWNALFGPLRIKPGPEGDEPQKEDHAGALVVGDARLVALPVRSFLGTFAWVTSPLLVSLAHRDLMGLKGLPERLPRLSSTGARVGPECITVTPRGHKLLLEDLDLDTQRDPQVDAWARFLALPCREEEEGLRQRLAVVDDETMSFLLETATQVETRIRIDAETGTVARGALWQEESLPAESLLLGVLAAGRSVRPDTELSAARVLERALEDTATLQLGGKATVGRGRCRLSVWPGAAKGSQS